MSSQEQQSQESLDKKLNTIITPLYAIIFNQFAEFSQGVITREKLDENVNDVLALAVLEGVKLSELVDEKLDEKLTNQIAKDNKKLDLIETMSIDRAAKDASIALNMQDKSGNFNRFVAPSDILIGKVKVDK